jgi:type III restriction enzyme
MSFEVAEPILNAPFEAPARHWLIRPGETPELRVGRRPAMVFKPRNQQEAWDTSDGVLALLPEYERGYALVLVERIRERLAAWREAGYPGVTRTTRELLEWWRRDGRERRLFFAQLEAAETVVFLTEARADFRQGIEVPREEVRGQAAADGHAGFLRYACKMATGSGKTTVMGMLAAWSILNKVTHRADARFSDVVLVVCPNVTIRDRLRELDPTEGEASLYRTRDLVPAHLMPLLARGRVLVTNWHVFEPQETTVGDTSARVTRTGVRQQRVETITIGPKTTTARGSRYLSLDDFRKQVDAGLLDVVDVVQYDNHGQPKKIRVASERWVESDTALLVRVLGREIGGKRNILVFNDEAHHAYRILREEEDDGQLDLEALPDEEDAAELVREATVWVEGLDRIHRLRGINACIDLSATPYYLGRIGRDAGRPFPWVVSDFGLVDAIESGLVKIPQLAARDTSGDERAKYFNLWKYVLERLTAAERGGKKGAPKPEAILKHAHTPLAILAGEWEDTWNAWQGQGDPRPPVFIVVCKNTAIAKVLFEWVAEDRGPAGIPSANMPYFRNRDGEVNTIRVDSKVVHETDTDGAKGDEARWMRFTLDTVGRLDWTRDRQGHRVYPTGFEELAHKLGRPLHPPGRDVRCIVSVGMLTEGWDANTVTHVVGLRPFMSQLLCEQVVGRALRRASYEPMEDGRFPEEVAQVFGVPFEVIPFKATGAPAAPAPKRFHVHALPARRHLEIRFPRVEGYTQSVRNRVTLDWDAVAPLTLAPDVVPPEVEMRGLVVDTRGAPALHGPGRVGEASLARYRAGRRVQELVFDLARDLTRNFVNGQQSGVPPHVLFPQMRTIVDRYLRERVTVVPPNELVDVGCAPYYGLALERLLNALRPDTTTGEAPELPVYETHRGMGSTADVDYWTSKDVREVAKSHVNYVVADTARWEQQAAYYLDRHAAVAAFVKNAGLGLVIPYLHDGQGHDFVPDFIVRLVGEPAVHLILETKGYDPLAEVKEAAARRWVSAVNADGRHGEWRFRMARSIADVAYILNEEGGVAVVAA